MTPNFQRWTAAVSGTIATMPEWPATISRWIGIVSGRIPDISRIPAKKRVSLGVAISLLIHLILILLFALIFGGQMERIDFAQPKSKPRNIELTVVEPEPEPIVPFTLQPKQEMPFIDSRGLDLARDPALNPIFQADENMKAASELPATGDAPLPSQEGRDRPFNAFKTQRSLLGSSAQPFPPAEPAPPLATPTPPAPQPLPPQLAKQEPVKPTPPDPTEKKEEEKPEEPGATVPMKLAQPPRTDTLAMRTNQSKRDVRRDVLPPPETKPAATPAPPDQQAMLTTPPPRPQTARESGYQPEQEINRIEGNISNRGKKSVDAVATPIAKYRKQVNDAIGSRWYFYVKDPQRMSLIAPGSARLSFFIDAQGQIVGIKLESNSSNESFAELCTSAIRDAREQIKDLKFPVDAALPLKDGRLEYSLTFTFYNL